MKTQTKNKGGGAVGRPRMYKDNAEKTAAYIKKRNVQRIPLELRQDATINKPLIKAAADALSLPMAALCVAAIHKYIVDTMGAERIENTNEKNRKRTRAKAK